MERGNSQSYAGSSGRGDNYRRREGNYYERQGEGSDGDARYNRYSHKRDSRYLSRESRNQEDYHDYHQRDGGDRASSYKKQRVAPTSGGQSAYEARRMKEEAAMVARQQEAAQKAKAKEEEAAKEEEKQKLSHLSEDQRMMLEMGFPLSFETTHDSKVPDNAQGFAKVTKKRNYGRYMNKFGTLSFRIFYPIPIPIPVVFVFVFVDIDITN